MTRLDRYAATGYVERVTAGHGTAAATSAEYEYDAFANVTLVRDGLGRETTFEYDAHDHVVRTLAPAPFANETRLRYDANDQVVQIDRKLTGGTLPAPGTTDPLDGWETTLFVYDAFSRVTTTVDDLGQSTTFTYDANGNVATTTDANSRVTTFQYDERDLPWRAIDSQTPNDTTDESLRCLVPAMHIFAQSKGREAQDEARALLKLCRAEGTTGAKYVASAIEGVMIRSGYRS